MKTFSRDRGGVCGSRAFGIQRAIFCKRRTDPSRRRRRSSEDPPRTRAESGNDPTSLARSLKSMVSNRKTNVKMNALVLKVDVVRQVLLIATRDLSLEFRGKNCLNLERRRLILRLSLTSTISHEKKQKNCNSDAPCAFREYACDTWREWRRPSAGRVQ